MTKSFIVKISNLSFKDTEEGILSLCNKYGTVSRAILNKDTQSCKVYFKDSPHESIFKEDIICNHKILKIVKYEAQKDKIKNLHHEKQSRNRLFLSHINKNLKIIDVRKAAKSYGKLVDVRVQNAGKRMRNKGYCFIEFKKESDAEKFIQEFSILKEVFGEKSIVEFAKTALNK